MSRPRGWALYWRNRNERWFRYPDVDPSKDIRSLLDEIDADPTGIFWDRARHKADTSARPHPAASGTEPLYGSVPFAAKVDVRRGRPCLPFTLLGIPYKQEVTGSNPVPPISWAFLRQRRRAGGSARARKDSLARPDRRSKAVLRSR